MICNYCNKEAEWVSNEVIYGKRYGKSYMMWLCRPCEAWVGCHCNTEKPLGTLAKLELRNLRRKAKELFIEKKLSGKWGRNYAQKEKAYKWLRKTMKLSSDEAHFGMFDETRCRYIINTLKA